VYNGVMRRALGACLVAIVCACPVAGQVVLPPNMGVPGGAENVPTPNHDLALEALAAGDYAAAADIAANEYQGGVRIGAQRWIDSIASSALLGECLYELGRFGDAVVRYDESMISFATHGDWLLALQFQQQPLQPVAGGRVATWGRSERNTAPAAIPETVAMRQKAADPQTVLQRGGVLAADYDRLVRPQEIMRLFVIAIYRHRVLLGDLATESGGLDAATKVLIRRPARPNHWSQAWVDVALGAAHWSQGRHDLATPLLNRGLVVGNGLDHALTSWGLIILGRMALDSDRPQQAAKLFEEATYAAADFRDARALEEAFALAATAHAMAGTRGVPATIKAGCDWARGKTPVLRARLLAIEAERLVAAGDTRGAAAALRDIDGQLLRGEAGNGTLGGMAAYAGARIDYAAGDVAAGDARLEAALAIARQRSPRLFQTARLVDLLTAGSSAFSDRQAETLFEKLLADPDGRDLAVDPLGSLATLATPRAAAFDAWHAVALRRGEEEAIEAAEAAVRHRWTSVQPLGARRLAVERLLSADPRTLAPEAAAQRASLLGGRGELAAAVDRMTQLRGTFAAALAAGPGAGGDGNAAIAAPDWEAYLGLAARRSQFVAEIAAGRDAVPIDFPPLTAAPEIRQRLAPRQLILSFRWTSSGLYGLLESKDRHASWQVRQAGGLPDEIKALAKGLCLFDPVAPVPTARLREGDWRGSAERIERMLFENSKITLSEGIDELVIVPDSWLWYVPFELLPVASSRPNEGDSEGSRLRDACRIRYAPTRSLAVMRCEPLALGPVGVHAGRMVRSDKPADAEAILAHFATAIDNAAPLRAGDRLPIPIAAAACDTLAIFDELSGEGPVATWPLVPTGLGKGAVTFGEWLASATTRPKRILLPGLQTAMAGGFEKLPARPGEELFVASTDLLAAGARTAVISRWRTGGKSCLDLMTEFLRDAAVSEPPEASVAWQRAVDIVLAEEPDATREPRVKPSPDAPLGTPLHPFLWAGYMLVDCGGGRSTVEPPPAGNQPSPPAAPPANQPAARP
jgi:tetratricopeptide (TPR) repeat protein